MRKINKIIGSVLCAAVAASGLAVTSFAEHRREYNDFEMILIEENGDITVTEGMQGGFSLTKQYEKDKLKVVKL